MQIVVVLLLLLGGCSQLENTRHETPQTEYVQVSQEQINEYKENFKEHMQQNYQHASWYPMMAGFGIEQQGKDIVLGVSTNVQGGHVYFRNAVLDWAQVEGNGFITKVIFLYHGDIVDKYDIVSPE